MQNYKTIYIVEQFDNLTNSYRPYVASNGASVWYKTQKTARSRAKTIATRNKTKCRIACLTIDEVTTIPVV